MPRRAARVDDKWNCYCPICGKLYHRNPSEVKKHGSTYCSMKCMAQDYKTRLDAPTKQPEKRGR